MPPPAIPSPGHIHAGFRVEEVVAVPEQRATAVLYLHPASGARLLRLVADDPENLFAVALRTPPPDDTGLPHILEHTVLCGSEKFPVKDPFVELLKTSLATFLNAYTWPDRTIYPCASMNPADFLNLVRVYADAVFKPLITEEHFKQEGHHLRFEKPGDTASALTIQGIVYNEMKGAYGDLEGVLGRELERALFPDNAYGRDSGGDPEAIPSLDYEHFVAFHREYYHPSNAFFFLYGGLPAEPVLELLDREYLADRPAIAIDTAIAVQPRWSRPRRLAVPYPIDADDDPAAKTAVLLAWMTNDLRDSVATLGMEILNLYLLDHAGSPLRKALIDSGLGEEVSDYSGYARHQRDTFFAVGLKGSEADRADAVEALVLDTCRREAENGLDPELLASAFHQGEISARRIRSQYPLSLMERVFGQWLYDAPPWSGLEIGRQLDELRRRHVADPRHFAELLRREIVDNPHRLRIVCSPDPKLGAREAARFAARMAEKKAALAPDELARVDENARRLEANQETPNSPEALATLPRLSRADVSDEPMFLPTRESADGGWTGLRADVFANGLAYFDLYLPLPVRAASSERAGEGSASVGVLTPELIDYLPLYTECFMKMGGAGFDYARLARREAAVCGALSATAAGSVSLDRPGEVGLGLRLHLSGLERNWPEALAVLADRWRKLDLDDRARLKDIVLQMRVAARDGVVGNGHVFARMGAASGLAPAPALAERLGGVSQIRFIDELADHFDERVEEIRARLLAIRAAAAAAGGATSAFVGGDEAHRQTRAWLAEQAEQAGQAALARRGSASADGIGGDDALMPWLRSLLTPSGAPAPRQGWAVASDVAFVAQALRAPGQLDPLAPALALLAGQLDYGFLWNEIRVKGGAYGARAAYDPLGGVLGLSSYRDPAVFKTLAVYARAGGHVAREMDLTPGGLEQKIIGTIKTLDHPPRPERACQTALSRKLSGMTDVRRREYRRRLLNLDAATVRRAGEFCFGADGAATGTAPVCVIAGREKLAAENASAGDAALPIATL